MTKIKMMIFYFENWDVILKKINILLFVMHELSVICKFISFTFCPLRTHLLCSLSVTWANQVNEVLLEVSSVFFVKCYFCSLRCSGANREAWSKAGQSAQWRCIAAPEVCVSQSPATPSQLITFTLLLLFVMGRGGKFHMCIASPEERLNEKGHSYHYVMDIWKHMS